MIDSVLPYIFLEGNLVKKTKSMYLKMDLSTQVFLEANSMAEYALAKGKPVTPSVIETVQSYYKQDLTEEEIKKDFPTMDTSKPIGPLVKAHVILAKLIEPAKPSTIFQLNVENKIDGFWKFLGPVSLIRKLMVAAAISLVVFVATGLTPDVDGQRGGLMADSGFSLFLNLVFFLSAAGLGASFNALYRANSYITKGTFDPTFDSSYWIRFSLGLISGLILSVMVSVEWLDGLTETSEGSSETAILAPGVARPLMAMLGGFSADLFYTFLSRLVETFQSLFQGSTKNKLESKTLEMKTELESRKVQDDARIASELISLQKISAQGADPEEIQRKIDAMFETVLPHSDISDDKTKNNNDTSEAVG